MTSYYIAYPRCEEINSPSSNKIIKVGISEKISLCSEQAYVNSRYGRCTTLLVCEYKGLNMMQMTAVEQRVLHELIHKYGYELQRCKKEHFVIGDSVSEEETFVYIVRALYNRFCDRIYQNTRGRWVTEKQPSYDYYKRHNHIFDEYELDDMHSRRSRMENNRLYKEKLERERLELYEKEKLEEERRMKKEKSEAIRSHLSASYGYVVKPRRSVSERVVSEDEDNEDLDRWWKIHMRENPEWRADKRSSRSVPAWLYSKSVQEPKNTGETIGK